MIVNKKKDCIAVSIKYIFIYIGFLTVALMNYVDFFTIHVDSVKKGNVIAEA